MAIEVVISGDFQPLAVFYRYLQAAASIWDVRKRSLSTGWNSHVAVEGHG
jgi:hypothetical protein